MDIKNLKIEQEQPISWDTNEILKRVMPQTGVDKLVGEQVKKTNEKNHAEDALEVLKRINSEKEEKQRKEIEVARRKMQEQERIDAIMNANKVDVNTYIEAGKAAKRELDSKKEIKDSEDKKLLDDDSIRAMEIIERLNHEAKEDAAKKRAEIESVRLEAEKRVGK